MMATTVDVQDTNGETIRLTRWAAHVEPEDVDSWVCDACYEPVTEGWCVYLGSGGLTIYCDTCTADTFPAPED
jgi:hypothetical protein